MFRHSVIWYSTVAPADETYVYEDASTGIVFTTYGSIPDSDEIEHVADYHAGNLCPVATKAHGRVCVFNIQHSFIKRAPCHDFGLAGKW